MIGNDIIDLQVVRSESIVLQQRRLDKICTLAEQRYIRQAENPWQAFWLIWTRKEACYKAFQRNNYIHSICPHQIENQIDPAGILSETICFRGKQFFVQTAIDGSKIHSICTSTPERLKDIHVLDDLLELLYLFDFKKDTNGLPFLQTKNNHRLIPVSKSSHGAFTAYALFKTDIANLDSTTLVYA